MAANMKTEEQEQQEILFSIQKQYFQMVPIKLFGWKNIAQHLDSTLQKVVLQKTYMSNQFFKYTPSIRYKRMFLKQLMKISEEANHELVDELYECYAEVISKVDDDQSPCYKTYILPSGSGIIVEESQNIISQGTTGLSTWQAALYMLEWILENSKEFENRNVVELGCGLGLLGLSICMSCNPWHYIFTDCHEAVLGKLNKNLSINGFQRNADSNCHCGTEDETVLPKCPCISKSNKLIGSNWTFDLTMNNGCNDRCVLEYFREELQCSDSRERETVYYTSQECSKFYRPPSTLQPLGKDCKSQDNVKTNGIKRVQLEEKDLYRKESRDRDKVNVASIRLDWENVSMDDLEGLSCGVILATDVIYDVELIKFFVPVVFKLLSCHGDGVIKPVAFVTSTVRNPETFEYFLQELVGYNIKWKVLNKPSRKLFFYDDDSDIRLLKLEIRRKFSFKKVLLKLRKIELR